MKTFLVIMGVIVALVVVFVVWRLFEAFDSKTPEEHVRLAHDMVMRRR